jgi:hypothetical protein
MHTSVASSELELAAADEAKGEGPKEGQAKSQIQSLFDARAPRRNC